MINEHQRRYELQNYEHIYRSDLEHYSLPDTVKRTGNDPSDQGRRDLHDNWWELETEDPTIKIDTKVPINFDSNVDFGGIRLSHPALAIDRANKKIVVLNKLGMGFGSKPLSARICLEFSGAYDWFIRWRLSRGIFLNSGLNANDFKNLCDLLATNDILNLVPFRARLKHLFREFADETKDISDLTAASDASDYFDWRLLARWMGVTHLSLSTSPQLRQALLEELAPMSNNSAKRIKRLLASHVSIPRPNKTRNTVMRYLTVWRTMQTLSEKRVLSPEIFKFDAFEGRSARSLAADIAAEAARTTTLHPDDFYRILRVATDWVLNYTDHIIEGAKLRIAGDDIKMRVSNKRKLMASRIDELNEGRPDGAPDLYHGWRVGMAYAHVRPGQISINQALHHLAAACAIIVGCFTARRVGEVQSLRADCIIELANGQYDLSTYIEKTLRDMDRIPIPPIVKIAVDTLKRIVSLTEVIEDGTWLMNRKIDTGKDQRERLTVILQDFVEFNKIEPPKGETKWNIAYHQLRRGFGVFYYHGFQQSSINALSWMYWHLDPNMTRWYVTEAIAGNIGRLREELDARARVARSQMTEADIKWEADAKTLLEDLAARGQAFNEARVEAFAIHLLNIHRGTERAIGRGAARLYADLKSMVSLAQADIRITSRSNDGAAYETALLKRITNYVGINYLEPVPGGVAHCTLAPGDEVGAEKAECLKLKAMRRSLGGADADEVTHRGPDFAFSGAYPCLNCEFCVALKANQRRIQEKLERVADSRDRAATVAAAESADYNYEKLKNSYLGAEQAMEVYA